MKPVNLMGGEGVTRFDALRAISPPVQSGAESPAPQKTASPEEGQNTDAGSTLAPAQNSGPNRPDDRQLKTTIDALNNSLDLQGRNLMFSIDQDTGITVIQIRDRKTDELILQIPPDVMLNLAKNLGRNVGTLFADEA